jgi:hypothetical protein
MNAIESPTGKPNWQLIFLQSRVNGAAYNDEKFPGRNWDWPKDTYLQRRLHRIKFSSPLNAPNVLGARTASRP